MDLSKAFDTLHENLLLAKLNACGFSFNAIKLVQNYFWKWFQTVNVNNSFSEWCKIRLAVPRRSIIGSLLFNIFINDIFHFIQEPYTCNFADNNSLYSTEDNFKEVKTIVKKNFKLIQVRYHENDRVLNPGKGQYLIRNKDTANESIKLGKKTLHAEAEQKLLGKIIDNDLKFQNDTKSVIKTVNQTLIRVTPFMIYLNSKVLFNSFLKVSSIILPYCECLALELWP